MPNIGPVELIIILVIALIVIGPGRLPDVGAALGKSIREFRKASTDVADATRVDTSPLPPSSSGRPVETNSAAPTAAPSPTPQPPAPNPTASTIPGPIQAPTAPSDDEPTNLPA
jgi:sec-independent protein translocase protein TatA